MVNFDSEFWGENDYAGKIHGAMKLQDGRFQEGDFKGNLRDLETKFRKVEKAAKVVSWQAEVRSKNEVYLWKATAKSSDKTTLVGDGKLQGTALSGNLNFKGQFADLAFLLSSSDRYLGDISSTLNLSGTLQNPQFFGDIFIKNGVYQHAEFGTYVRNIEMAFKVKGTNLTVVKCSGTDFHKGSARCHGGLDFVKHEGGLTLDVTKFAIANSDTVTARADASLKIMTSKDGLKVSGQAKVTRADFDLKDTTNDVKLIRVKEDPKVLKNKEKVYVIGSKKSGIILDLTAEIGEETYVHGLGLESYWQGQLSLKGEMLKPTITGDLTLKKGTLSVGSKKMDLLKGKITFDGDRKFVPIVSLQAQKEIGGYMALLKVEGKANEPIIEISSVPGLPIENVMALILFGKTDASTSSSQSLQLALAMATLKGGGLGLGDKLVRVFGFDHLTVDQQTAGAQDDDGGYKVRLGKQLSDRVYVSLKQETGATPSTGATLEVDVTNNTKVSVDVGTGQQSNGVSYNWEKRY